MLPKKGRKLPKWEGVLAGRQVYAETIAQLLEREHGGTHRAVKQLMTLTDASERTVKHWLSGQHGPDTVFFLRLVTSSPVIRAFVIGLIESSQGAGDGRLGVDQKASRRPSKTSDMQPPRQDRRQNDRINDPKTDPINDPITDALNERQRWFLGRVAAGHRCRAADICGHWKVSAKTARRDIAALSASGLICFTGARRNGRYRPASGAG
ncbi:DeoR family transcriptional regulator [Sphingomonas sp.]|uniref:DeoR family transcriptional regulator n=1 Tax=Sphingomonas sp. TaxID=28214 RepID=UPI001D5FA145|nr:DeoR family transcriptional regulator [Sphingomonas sp.]MBX9796511.1 DeoR family transcriptional regulator [Sphingomonas sp.]